MRVRLGDACSRGQLSQEAAEAYAVSTLEGAVMLQLHRRRQGSRARAFAATSGCCARATSHEPRPRPCTM